MIDTTDIVQTFISVWNEQDPVRRREMVRSVWTEDGHHLMGTQNVRGHAALEERVAASHQASIVEKGYEFRAATAIQWVPGAVKFRWNMVRQNTDEVVAAGVGLLQFDDGGRVRRDYLFTEH